jgi:ATP-dependent exoDNAse (exonuclease V) beta subunit
MPHDLEQAIILDEESRRTALTDLGRSLLLEAGAGSGKTSILAGRVIRLLAEGRHPSSIAAISFTELSAAELRERIAAFIDRLLSGDMPVDLTSGFYPGLSLAQHSNLLLARGDLDDLVCTTIHGFCRELLTPYPVEAGIDPGAAMMDEGQASLLLTEVQDQWLRDRLSGAQDPSDTFVAIHLAAPSRADALMRDLVKLLLRRRGAGVSPCPTPYRGEEVRALAASISSFERLYPTLPAWAPPEFRAAAQQIIEFGEDIPGEGATEADYLGFAVRMEVPPACATSTGTFGKDKTVGTTQATWKRSAEEVGETAARSKTLAGQAKAAFDQVRDAFESVLSAASGRILHVLAEQAMSVLRHYGEAKRRGAYLDFGDLLEKTRILLERHPEVRLELASRIQTVLVDEFQDTDIEQTEILWRLCGEPPAGNADAPWKEWGVRPGALFLVGDPQQSIYRFRGADLAVFKWTRKSLTDADPAAVLGITRNFRSRSSILDWVNRKFEPHLSVDGQCGFTGLTATVDAELTTLSVAALDIAPTGTSANAVRDAEAEAVARICKSIVGQLDVRGSDGVLRKCEPGDIALLVPGGTELWRYERALEDVNLSVSAQAGKGFFRRQEVQDLIALTRTIADERDRLALGALLRGPLVGLTVEELLDAVEMLPGDPDGRPPMLSLRMQLPETANAVLLSRLTALRGLADARNRTTPHLLLSRAVEEIGVRALLRARGGRIAERALANVDMFLEMARAYSVRGLRAFSDAMREQWEEAQRAVDGRPDAASHSINLITMHSAKGLEWPVVIPVNTFSRPDGSTDSAYDSESNLIHLPVFGDKSADCIQAFALEKGEATFERERLWYVATTRARDLLLMPRLAGGADKSAWCSVITFDLDDLPPHGLPPSEEELRPDEITPNGQSEDQWVLEAAAISAARPKLSRRTPHLAEEGDPSAEQHVFEMQEVISAQQVRGGLKRGLVLHKLLEEALTGEIDVTEQALASRGGELVAQLAHLQDPDPEPLEMARCVIRTLLLEEVAAVRDQLVPEWNVAASHVIPDGSEELILGVADAVVPNEFGPPVLVVDWKSDVEPSARKTMRYSGQLAEYLRATGASEGLLVYLTTGQVVRVT